uniref:J domain-containing protein n=1 Tax=Strongyloides stercoralis TaxID=6248 RepID=A0A0K0E9G9_STRER
MIIIGYYKSNLYKFILIILLLIIFSISQCEIFEKKRKGSKILNKKFYNFNMTNVNSFYHKVAVSALIKSKAKKVLKQLPKVEEIIFWQCSNEAKKLNDLAKCVVSLFNIRDRLIKEGKLNPLNLSENKNYNKEKEFILSPKYNKLNIRKIHKKIKVYNTTKFNLIKKEYNNIKEQLYRIKNPIEVHEINRLKHLKKVEIKNEFYKRMRVKKSINSFNQTYNDIFIDEDFLQQIKLLKEKEKSLPPHLRNLKRLERFNKMSEHVDKYIQRMNRHNEEIISKYNTQLKLKMKDNNYINKENQNVFNKIMDIVNDLLLQKQKFSFLSPRIFNIIPPCKNGNTNKCNNKKRLLSPTIFSFHEDDGYLNIPSLMKSIVDNDMEQNQWLNLILEISGASTALQKTIDKLNPQIEAMENKIFPAIVNIEKMDYIYSQTLKMYNKKQLYEMNEDGYTFLSSDQLKLLNNNDKDLKIISKIESMSRKDLEKRLENEIRNLAKIGDNNIDYNYLWNQIFNNNKRQKRQLEVGSPGREDPEASEGEGREPFVNLKPFAFFNRIGEPVTLEAATLSPHAFISEILSPEALTVQTLSPRAFVATVLSPSALVARILSPGFFRAEVLSPRALTAWVLSPDFLLVEVLTPKFIEPRILSPEYLQIQILSPTFISPRVLSQEGVAVLVLSPNILSPNILSRESLIVEVLSPHILGGHEHTESGESAEGEITGEHHTENHVPHGHHSEFHPIHIHTYPFSHQQIPHAPSHIITGSHI